MKKISAIATVLAIAALLPITASAAEFRGAQEATLSPGETINGNLYMAGGTVTDVGVVKGDVVVGGGTVLVAGPISQDLLIGGGNITVTSDVGGDVRIGGGNIAMQGKVTGDAVIGGGNITLASSQIGGDVAVAGGSITIESPINGNLRAAGGQITINAPIKGSVIIQANKVTLGPKAQIQGDFSYTSPTEATLEAGAAVQGKTAYTKSETTTPEEAPQAALAAFFTFWLFAKLLMELLGAFIFFWIFPRYARELATQFAEKPLESLGKGFVTFIVLPIAGILLLFTVIGIPLGFLALLGFAGLMIFATLATPIAFGALVHKWIWKPAQYVVDWKTIILGVAIYFVLTFIPVIGWIIKFAAILMTLGVAMQIKWAAAKNLR